jgi:hypothetical protein
MCYEDLQIAIESRRYERDFETLFELQIDPTFPRVGPYRNHWKKYEMFILSLFSKKKN